MLLYSKSSCCNPAGNKGRNTSKQTIPSPCRQCCSNAWKPCVSTVTKLWCITKLCWRTCCQPWQQQWGDKESPETAASCALSCCVMSYCIFCWRPICIARQANNSRVRPITQVSISMTCKHWYVSSKGLYAKSTPAKPGHPFWEAYKQNAGNDMPPKKESKSIQSSGFITTCSFTLCLEAAMQYPNVSPQCRNAILPSPGVFEFRSPLYDGHVCNSIDILGLKKSLCTSWWQNGSQNFSMLQISGPTDVSVLLAIAMCCSPLCTHVLQA